MRDRRNGSTSPLTPPNIFSAEFLDKLRERDEPITAFEAEFGGPWKVEPVAGRPGALAVLRRWESLEVGDVPEGIFWHPETAALLEVCLPILAREPRFHLEDAEAPEGYPVTAVFGEQGPVLAGWLRHAELQTVEALHLLDGVVRSPAALAALLKAAGPIAIEQVGRILAGGLEI